MRTMEFKPRDELLNCFPDHAGALVELGDKPHYSGNAVYDCLINYYSEYFLHDFYLSLWP